MTNPAAYGVGHPLAFRDVGVGPALVLLHGLGGSGRSWSLVVRELSDRYRLVSVDLPGHGSSPQVAAGMHLSVTTMAQAVRATLAGLGLTSPVLIGHSIGGFVALDLAISAFGRGLVLIDSEMGRATLGWLDDLARYRDVAAARGMTGLFEVLSKEDPATREALARRPEDLPRYQAAFEQVDATSFLAVATAGAERADRSGEIGRLTIPTLSLVGSLDAPFLDPARRFAQATGGTVQVLPGAGHVPMLDQPHLVAEAIDAFCSALGGPS